VKRVVNESIIISTSTFINVVNSVLVAKVVPNPMFLCVCSTPRCSKVHVCVHARENLATCTVLSVGDLLPHVEIMQR